MPIEPELGAALELTSSPLAPTDTGRDATVTLEGDNHYGENCLEAESSVDVPVSSIDSPLRLTLVLDNGSMEAWVNDVLVETSTSLTTIEVYGFYSQIYHRPRSHIHYDDIIITGP